MPPHAAHQARLGNRRHRRDWRRWRGSSAAASKVPWVRARRRAPRASHGAVCGVNHDRVTDVESGDRAQRDGLVGRTAAAEADRGQRFALQFGEHGRAGHGTAAALLGADAERRVALHVFDVAEAFRQRHAQVGHRDIVLQVDELALLGGGRGGRAREGLQARWRITFALRRRTSLTRRVCLCCSMRAGGVAIREGRAEFETTVGAAGMPACIGRCGCDECVQRLRKAARGAAVKTGMERGRPATADQNRIAADLAWRPAAMERCDARGPHAAAAVGTDHRVCGQALDACCCQRIRAAHAPRCRLPISAQLACRRSRAPPCRRRPGVVPTRKRGRDSRTTPVRARPACHSAPGSVRRHRAASRPAGRCCRTRSAVRARLRPAPWRAA